MQIGKCSAVAVSAAVGVTPTDSVYLDFNWLCRSSEESPDAEALRSRFFVTKKGGEPLPMKIAQLKEAFGWDGQDLYWFEDQTTDGTLQDIQVALVLEANNWTDKQGKDRIGFQVAWINNPVGNNQTPGNGRIGREDFKARFGGKFRTVSGPKPVTPKAPGSPAKAPGVNTGTETGAGPKTAAPVKPAPKAGPKMTRTPVKALTSTESQAWDLITRNAEERVMAEADRDKVWFDAVNKIAEGRPQDQLTPEDWGKVLVEIEAWLALPF